MSTTTAPRISVGRRDLNTRPHVLYRFYDRTDVLLYIGITADMSTRLDQHRREKPWWSEVANIKLEHYDSRRAALAAERAAIESEKPLYNDQHNEMVALTDERYDLAESILLTISCIKERHARFYEMAQRVMDERSECDDWQSRDLHERAAEVAVEELDSKYHLLRRALGDLLDVIDDDRIAKYRAEVAGGVLGEADGEADAVTARRYAGDLAVAYLDELPVDEADEWIRGAVESGDACESRFAAGRNATRFKRTGQTPFLLCQSMGEFGASCPRTANVLIAAEDCVICSDSECRGHFLWCEQHAASLIGRGYLRAKSDDSRHRIIRHKTFDRSEARLFGVAWTI